MAPLAPAAAAPQAPVSTAPRAHEAAAPRAPVAAAAAPRVTFAAAASSGAPAVAPRAPVTAAAVPLCAPAAAAAIPPRAPAVAAAAAAPPRASALLLRHVRQLLLRCVTCLQMRMHLTMWRWSRHTRSPSTKGANVARESDDNDSSMLPQGGIAALPPQH